MKPTIWISQAQRSGEREKEGAGDKGNLIFVRFKVKMSSLKKLPNMEVHEKKKPNNIEVKRRQAEKNLIKILYFLVIFQAIKYLERIIVEAQSQKSESNETAKSSDEKLDNSENLVKIKTELNTSDDVDNNNASLKPDPADSNLNQSCVEDVEMTDLSKSDNNNSEIKSELVKCDSNSETLGNDSEINVDPRTYCKLGHFHLMLEDYSKGKNSISNIYFLWVRN